MKNELKSKLKSLEFQLIELEMHPENETLWVERFENGLYLGKDENTCETKITDLDHANRYTQKNIDAMEKYGMWHTIKNGHGQSPTLMTEITALRLDINHINDCL